MAAWHEKFETGDAMNKYTMSWVIGFGPSSQGGSLKAPTWVAIKEKLAEMSVRSGSVTLNLVEAPEIGPQSLEVLGEGGYYILTLGEDTGDDYVVRTFSNSVTSDGDISVLGNRWSRRLACTDLSLVVSIFEEFLSNGDVSREILN